MGVRGEQRDSERANVYFNRLRFKSTLRNELNASKKHLSLFQATLKILLFKGNRAETEKEKEIYAMKVLSNASRFFFS